MKVGIITLATNDQYAKGAMVLGRSLRKSGTVAETICMISSDISPGAKLKLEMSFDRVIVIGRVRTFLLWKISIFVQDFDFCQKFWCLSKISIFFSKISICVKNIDLCQKFRFVSKISIFVKKIQFLSSISIFVKHFDFCQKFWFLVKISIFPKISMFVKKSILGYFRIIGKTKSPPPPALPFLP